MPKKPTRTMNVDRQTRGIKRTSSSRHTTTTNTNAMNKDLKVGRWQGLRWRYKIGIIIGLLFIVTCLAAYNFIIGTANSIINTDNPTPLIEQLGILFGNEKRPLKGESEDRINVLLLGIGGAGHDGSTLTDSIMVASITPSTHQVALLSLPRDLVVKIYDEAKPKYWEGRKINNAYELGGMDLVEEKVNEVTGLDLHYYVLIDFSAFKQIIDDVGGVDIDIERSFTGLYGANELSMPCPKAQLYRLDDGAYCAIEFTRGVEHMDGERALIFSRIRKLVPTSLNQEEGSDFARAQRQQKILEAFKETVLSSQTLLHPTRVQAMVDNVGNHLETNMELWEMAKFAQLAKDVNNDEIISKVVDDSPDGLVYSKIDQDTGAFVLIPTAGAYDYSEIHTFAKNMFKPETIPTLQETAELELLNGTSQAGLAGQIVEDLILDTIEIVNIDNAPFKVKATTIYDLTAGKKPSTLTNVQKIIGGNIATQTDTTTLLKQYPNDINSTVDFIIILGEDAIN